MEFAAESQGHSFSGNPFGDVIETPATPIFAAEIETSAVAEELKSGLTAGEIFARAFMGSGETLVGRITRGAIDKVVDLLAGVVRAGIEIVGQAIKVAVFKFGIELCAMAIKSLVETMSGKGLTPPSIDTKGVYYNMGQNASGANSSQQNTSYNRQPSFGDPFGNPFASNGMPF